MSLHAIASERSSEGVARIGRAPGTACLLIEIETGELREAAETEGGTGAALTE